MRSRVAAWLVATALLFAPVWVLAQAGVAPIPELDSPVVDTTGTLDAATRQRLEAQARALQQRKGAQLQVLVVPTTQPEDIAQYTVRVFDQWRLGREKVDDGVLLVVAKDDRRVRIEVGYGLEGAIPDAIAMRVIQEYLVPRFRAGDYAGGITEATSALVKIIDGEPLPEPMADPAPGGEGGNRWLLALLGAYMVARFARALLGMTARPVRGIGTALATGGVAWLLSSLWLVGGIAALAGLLYGLASGFGGRFAAHRGRGGYGAFGVGGLGGGFGGGGGGFGGGWGGGGGMSGGGGASGSW